jgi:competence protein ComFC
VSVVESLISVISPTCCIICNKQGYIICEQCSKEHIVQRKPACFWCNRLQPTGRTCSSCSAKTYLNGAVIPFRLDGPIQELIHRLKYNGDRAAGRYFAFVLSSQLPRGNFDCVSYVASTGTSQRRRGYNQAHIIAREVSSVTGIRLQNSLLRKAHIDQIGLNRKQRLNSVQNNFVLTSHPVANKRILLIDDVMTTGATLNECARVLKGGGAKSVWALAVAKK